MSDILYGMPAENPMHKRVVCHFFKRWFVKRQMYRHGAAACIALGHSMKYVLLALAAITCSSAGAVESQQWRVSGLGTDSCASYVLALDDNRPTAGIEMQGKTYYTAANAYTQWINGFVTAANMSGPSALSRQINVDVNGIALWVKSYCAAHPSEPVAAGAGAFVRAHRLRTK